MYTTKALSLQMAKKLAEAAESIALEHNIKIAIAIMDNHGNLKYFCRMDNSSLISISLSKLKARTSAQLPVSTKELAQSNQDVNSSSYSLLPGITLLEGGMPIITSDGQHIGGIGISGATPTLEGLCARGAIEAIAAGL